MDSRGGRGGHGGGGQRADDEGASESPPESPTLYQPHLIGPRGGHGGQHGDQVD